MVYGQGTPLMSPTMMYMSQYMNPYLQVRCEAKKNYQNLDEPFQQENSV